MSFKSIHGHEKQIRILQNVLQRNRLPHAYLFYGMEGVGKKTVAEVFAKAINCKAQKASRQGSDVDVDSCDDCPSCFKVDRKNHPDIVTIRADGQFIKVKEIRDIQEQMKFAPLEGGTRIIMIDNADRMNNISANALLKTLEEPTRSNLLILITASPHQLPATILSRCQHVRFNPLQTDQVSAFLQERLSMEPEQAYSIACACEGSIGRALNMGEDSSLTVRDEILNHLNSIDRVKEPLRFLSMIIGFGQEREDIMDRLNMLMTGYRDALILKETGDDNGLINRHCVGRISAVAHGLSGRDILHNIKTIDWAMNAIDRNANKQLTLEVMLFRLVRCRE